MNHEQSKYPDSTLQKLKDLRGRRDVIQRWAQTSQIPADSKLQLEEMLVQVDAELNQLQLAHSAFRDNEKGAKVEQTLVTTTVDVDSRSALKRNQESSRDI